MEIRVSHKQTKNLKIISNKHAFNSNIKTQIYPALMFDMIGMIFTNVKALTNKNSIETVY